jgi:hypothetical protein
VSGSAVKTRALGDGGDQWHLITEYGPFDVRSQTCGCSKRSATSPDR